jgi:DNA polymerase-3 subunit alpha (Gram-positive type)
MGKPQPHGAVNLEEAWDRVCASLEAKDAALAARLRSCRMEAQADGAVAVAGVDAVTEEAWRSRGVVAELEAAMERELGRPVPMRFRPYTAGEARRLREAWAQRERAYWAKAQSATPARRPQKVLLGRAFQGDPLPLDRLPSSLDGAVVAGVVFRREVRALRRELALWVWITDRRSSLILRVRPQKGDTLPLTEDDVPVGMGLWARGRLEPDRVTGEPVLWVRDLVCVPWPERQEAISGRVELHAHTRMSQMDAPLEVASLFARARAWGMPAVAVTDHGVVQAFPEAAQAAARTGVRALYGMEAYAVDDTRRAVMGGRPIPLREAEFVVVDLETSGLLAGRDHILEIGAVRTNLEGAEEIFHTLVAFDGPIPPEVTRITGITHDMLRGAPSEAQALERFWAFVGDRSLAAHNADFDLGFLRQRKGGPLPGAAVDTLALSRALLPELRSHRLDAVAAALGVPLERHHRALEDARATAAILRQLLARAMRQGVETEADLARLTVPIPSLRPYGVMLLVRTQQGLRDLYRLVTESHIRHFHRVPRVPWSRIEASRQGLWVGAPTSRGELVEGILSGASWRELVERARRYDYVEVTPPDALLAEHGQDGLTDLREAQEVVRALAQLAREAGVPLVAVSNAHTLDPEDRVLRQVLVHDKGGEAEPDGPFHLRTAEELMAGLVPVLGEEEARRAILEAPAALLAATEDVQPVPEGLAAPELAQAREEVEACRETAHRLYGRPLPSLIQERLDKEIRAITDHGFASIYATAARLVRKSLEDGYLVGSRGSVGSSLVAFLMGITEVNPLPPHYRCPRCASTVFAAELGLTVGSGVDLPPRTCPCGETMVGDGHDIPFETFMGFEGDKVPDIDLNFSGEYQPTIHRYAEEIFGAGSVFRAGTISTVAERTAYGLVKGYLRDGQRSVPSAEVDRLAMGITGVKRTTGQHPGGLMIVPQGRDVHEFTPVQHPADDPQSQVVTTHFDYHSIEGRLLKLDLLGHDDPTMLRLLEEYTGVPPRSVPLTDPEVLELFRSVRPLGVSPESIGTDLGTLGIPEFGTRFVRSMLRETQPQSFADLVRISGLSHGTDVWANNAQDLVRAGLATLQEVIATREDMLTYLTQRGIPPREAFNMVERVRKGKGLRPEDVALMRQRGVPDWYIQSCQKITYLFPKAHAVAYVTSAVRIAYFKVHHPEAFYAAHFSVQAADVDADLLRRGPEAVARRIREIESMGQEASPRDRSQLPWLEVAREMFARGIRVRPVDLYESLEDRFRVTPQGLLPPFVSLQGLGRAAAAAIGRARQDGPFRSVEDLRQRARLQRPVVELLEAQGCLAGLPATSQRTLF